MFLKKIEKIISRNLKLILRSKSSALIVVFGPLLLILLVGAAFNTANVYDVVLGVYSSNYDGLTQGILDELQGKQFSVNKMVSEQECIDNIKQGKVHVCTIFPPNLDLKNEGEIIFYVDPSRVNLVYAIMEGVANKIQTKSDQLSLQLATNVIDTLKSAGAEISDDTQLLSAVAENNDQLKTGLITINQDLQKVDLNYDKTVDFSAVENEISQANSAYNNSFLNLGKNIGRMKIALQDAQKKLSLMQNVQLSKSKELDNLARVSTASGSYLESLGDSFTKIDAEVNKVGLTSASKIASPIKTSIKPVVSKNTNLNFLFPTLLVMVIMFSSIMLSSNVVIREKTGAAYFRNFITPTKEHVFIFGNFLTNLLVVLIQIVVIFIAASFYFGGTIVSVIGSLAILLLTIISVFILIGMIIGYVFKNQETGTLASISVSSIMLFFSNTILPSESLPTLFKNIVQYNPFIVGENLLRRTLLFQTDISFLKNDVYILLGFIAILFILVFLADFNSKRQRS